MTASILNRTLKAYRIGIHNNRYPIFDGTGAKLYPGRWNENYSVIYCGENYSLAMLEKLVHSNTGDLPEYQQWIEITIPVGTTYEVVTTYSLSEWKELSVSKNFGDNWLLSNRSCILIVPSAIAPVENNILINESHPQFSTITTSLNQPVVWDRRLFFPNNQ
ncbi:MAG: RES family NAD+ phosphorylase [Waterburya sp.]